MSNDEPLKNKIKETLINGYFGSTDDLVDVSNGLDDDIHVVREE